MRTLLHGRSRQIGYVALVLACALMGAWLRSLTMLDFIVPYSSKMLSIVMVSTGSEIDFYLLGESDEGFRPTTGWQSAATDEELADLWRIQYQRPQETYVQRVSYWCFVVPLTLVSACLLLTKSKQKRVELCGD